MTKNQLENLLKTLQKDYENIKIQIITALNEDNINKFWNLTPELRWCRKEIIRTQTKLEELAQEANL